MIFFDAETCGDLAQSSAREWLETNNRGGYASASICGMNTRRYHGLLVAAPAGESQRVVLLSRCEESIIVGSDRYELSTNAYAPSIVHPSGYKSQTNFRLDPFPVFTFVCGEVRIEKRVLMVRDENTTIVSYTLHSSAAQCVLLELRPLVAMRTYHRTRRANENATMRVTAGADALSYVVGVEGEPWRVRLAHDATEAARADVWYYNHEYAEEIERGFDDREDLFNPCVLRYELCPGEPRHLLAGASDAPAHAGTDAESLMERETARRKKIARRDDTLIASRTSAASSEAPASNEAVRLLLRAADAFLVDRRLDAKGDELSAPHRTVIAGYHWFTDWGRDAMIALPGLTMATNRLDDAEAVLLTFARHLRDGLIPNLFPDAGGEPSYNTADATLWFVHAAGELARRGRTEFVCEHLYEPLREIIGAHVRGTRYDIRVAPDGLLRVGTPDVQLTWMDAKIGSHVVTPRDGKPVEIQALWYNALRTVEHLAGDFGDDETREKCEQLAARARTSFAAKFWNDEADCLYDLVRDDDSADASLRPNQIFAVSLPHPVLDNPIRARAVVATVERELLTPYGLRSLSRSDPQYRPRYEGDVWSHDTAYHQGTVWAWLMGGFITAYLRMNERSPASIERAHEMLTGLRAHLSEAGAGHVSEVFDGDPPHAPRGCIAQAWSIAELLRCELEELADVPAR